MLSLTKSEDPDSTSAAKHLSATDYVDTLPRTSHVHALSREVGLLLPATIYRCVVGDNEFQQE